MPHAKPFKIQRDDAVPRHVNTASLFVFRGLTKRVVTIDIQEDRGLPGSVVRQIEQSGNPEFR